MVILVQKSRRPRRWAGVALLAGALVVVLWVEHREHTPAAPPDGDALAAAHELHADAAAPTLLSANGPAFSADPLIAHPPAAVGPPEGMSAEQWQALRDSLKDHPQREAEIARVADYMAFRARAERYRALREQGSTGQAEARQLATGLLDTLPTHVARGELSAGEARLMQQALLETLLPDGTQRQARQAIERQRLVDALPAAPELAATNDRNARFLREQSALVAAWQARPPAQRDSQQLETAIAALRQSIFDPQRKGGQQP